MRIETYAQQLLTCIRRGNAEAFRQALLGNAYDYEFVRDALFLCLDQSRPEDWGTPDDWFMEIRIDISAFIDIDSPDNGRLASTMRRWLLSSCWQDDRLGALRDFAQDTLQLLNIDANGGGPSRESSST